MWLFAEQYGKQPCTMPQDMVLCRGESNLGKVPAFQTEPSYGGYDVPCGAQRLSERAGGAGGGGARRRRRELTRTYSSRDEFLSLTAEWRGYCAWKRFSNDAVKVQDFRSIAFSQPNDDCFFLAAADQPLAQRARRRRAPKGRVRTDRLDYKFAKLPKLSASDLTSCADALSQVMLSVAHDTFPLKKHAVVGIPSPPWWDQECSRVVEERREAEILYCRNMSQENCINLLKIRAKSRRLLRRKKLERWRDFLYELKLVLSSLKDSAPSIDGISYSFLINASEQARSHYVDIVVITDDSAAYRSIALFSVLAKIAEHLAKNRLEWIAESRGLLANSHYGIRKGRSTIDSLSIFTSDIREQAEDASEAEQLLSSIYILREEFFVSVVRLKPHDRCGGVFLKDPY
ncbi:hypothetical protein EVAR_58888_1 [Eumeta japonica]|uniref:Uncharacterized protein n=1 Tax=Eumeta variegata TaxID=151549 RepID=A0A4C1ZDI8_EUMVA|nr:hypothetical protein EVAR_58888_1 [Eumeta japonica]